MQENTSPINTIILVILLFIQFWQCTHIRDLESNVKYARESMESLEKRSDRNFDRVNKNIRFYNKLYRD